MSKLDVIFRSIEHQVNLLYLRKIGGVLPSDLTHVISSLLKLYENDPMVLVGLNTLLNFRNKWAHSNSYDCRGVGIALDVIKREIDSVDRFNTTLTLLVATTKELLDTFREEETSVAEKEPSLDQNAKEFVPFKFEYSNRYQPRMIAEYKKTPELKGYIKGKMIKLLDGKHAGRLGEFKRFNGTVAWVQFEGETEAIAIGVDRLVQIINQ